MAAFSVAPSTSPSGCFSPVASMPTAATRIRSSWTCRPSIWIASRSRDDRSLASQVFSFALDSATNLRDTADFEVPSPLAEVTSPSGRRIERRNRRVETLISIWFIAHRPSQSSRWPAARLGSSSSCWPSGVRTRGRSMSTRPPRKRHRAPGLSPAATAPVLMALVALAAQVGGLVLQKILERFNPGQQTKVLKAALNLLEGGLHSITLLGRRTKRYHRSRFTDILHHGRCSSMVIQHPEPTGSGEQRPPQICNIRRDIPCWRQ